MGENDFRSIESDCAAFEGNFGMHAMPREEAYVNAHFCGAANTTLCLFRGS
jgi:hypothetical protein